MSDTTQFEIARVSTGATTHLTAWLARQLPSVVDRWLLVLCLVIIGCTLMLSVRAPQHLWAWLCAGLFLPAVVLGLRLTPAIRKAPGALQASLGRSLLGAGVLILVPLLLRLAEDFGVMQIGGVRRVIGVLLGCALVVIGSYLPQRALPILSKRAKAESVKPLASFLGTGFMFAGALYSLAWMIAPLAEANLWASTAFAAVVLFVGCRTALIANQRNR